MKTCVFYTNCQSHGVWHFLARTRLVDEFTPIFVNNWQLILGEQPPALLFESLAKADVLIYQPTDALACHDKSIIPDSATLLREFLSPRAIALSFAYQYNNGFFPIIKETATDYTTGYRVGELARLGDMARFWAAYNSGEMLFDCARRFVGCLAEQARRERTCDIKIAPFILENFQRRRLFLNQNHPTSAIFWELARQIKQATVMKNSNAKLADLMDSLPHPTGDNDANMNGELPIHPAVVRELGLQFGPFGDQTVFETYLRDYYATLNQKPR